LQRIEIFDVDTAALSEQHHQYRKADRRLGRRNRQNEEHEYLAADVAKNREKATKLKFTAVA